MRTSHFGYTLIWKAARTEWLTLHQSAEVVEAYYRELTLDDVCRTDTSQELAKGY